MQDSPLSSETPSVLQRQDAATTAEELLLLHEMPRPAPAKPFKKPRRVAAAKRKRVDFASTVSDSTSRIHTVTLNPVSPLREVCC